jgi:4-amino-4-deoxy-L-arabinose transferase-like glycosyltransferase
VRGLGVGSWPPDVLAEASPTRRGAFLYLVCLFTIAFWDLDGRAIYHHDVARFAVIAREMIRGGDWLIPHQHGVVYVNKPILYIWAVAGPSAMVGDVTVFQIGRAHV